MDENAPDWKNYSKGFTIPAGPEADAFVRDLERMKAEEHDRMGALLFGPREPAPTPTRRQRLRSWLGWKLWHLASRLEPDVVDY